MKKWYDYLPPRISMLGAVLFVIVAGVIVYFYNLIVN
jgi:hypothetical protein